MDDREFGFYMRCLNHSWVNDGLPPLLAELATAIGRSHAYVAKLWPNVGKCFTPDGNGRLRNPRQETDRADAIAKSVKATTAANIKYGRTADAHANGVPRAYGSESESDSESEVLKKQSSVRDLRDFEKRFSALYAHWKKLGVRQICCQYVVSALSDGVNFDEIESGIMAWVLYWDEVGWRYCKLTLEEMIYNHHWLILPPGVKAKKTRTEELLAIDTEKL
jgi:hypothetical protein